MTQITSRCDGSPKAIWRLCNENSLRLRAWPQDVQLGCIRGPILKLGDQDKIASISAIPNGFSGALVLYIVGPGLRGPGLFFKARAPRLATSESARSSGRERQHGRGSKPGGGFAAFSFIRSLEGIRSSVNWLVIGNTNDCCCDHRRVSHGRTAH